MVYFGPAGTAESFKNLGYKKTIQIPEYLERFSLTAFEYQCGRGVKIKDETAKDLAKYFKEKDIKISLHAPYFISMSSIEEEKRLNSVNYILQSANAVNNLGGNRVIFHSGSCSKLTRQQALDKALDTMQLMVNALDENGFSHITLCPETMGKVNQLGTLDEVLALCKVDKRITPCIDFGHLNARDNGSIKSIEDYKKIIFTMQDALGDERAENFHVHFSKIEYTKGGEKCHLTFDDTIYGPDFEPLMDIIYTQNLSPTIICESAGTQTEDAQTMQNYLNNIKKG